MSDWEELSDWEADSGSDDASTNNDASPAPASDEVAAWDDGDDEEDEEAEQAAPVSSTPTWKPTAFDQAVIKKRQEAAKLKAGNKLSADAQQSAQRDGKFFSLGKNDAGKLEKFVERLTADFADLSVAETQQSFIDQVFKSLQTRYVQVGHDKNRSFLVEGDSLLSELLCNDVLDWSHGGQVLALAYKVEQHLLRLTQGGRRLRVVFFDQMRSVWQQPSQLLAREIIIRHLSTNTPFPVHTISSWSSPDWDSFLTDAFVPFVMVGDGVMSGSVQSSHIQYLLQSFALHCLARGLHLVRTAEVFFSSNAMYGFEVQMAPDIRKHLATRTADLEGNGVVSSGALVGEMDSTIWDGIVSDPLLSKSGLRVVLSVFGVASALSQSAAPNADLAKAFLLHTVLLETLSLRQRAQNVTSTEAAVCAEAVAFFDEFSAAAVSGLLHAPVDFANAANVVDLLDARLFHAVLAFVAQNKIGSAADLGVDEAHQALLDNAWTRVTQLVSAIKSSTPLYPIESSLSVAASSAAKATTTTTHALTAVNPSKSALVKDLVGDVDSALAAANLVTEAPPLTESASIFSSFDWKDAEIIDDGIKPEEAPTNKWEKRGAAKYMAFMEKYARSLKGGKIVLRDVVVASDSKDKKSGKGGKGSSKSNAKNGGKQKGGGKQGKGGKGKSNIRDKIAAELLEKQRAEASETIQLFINMCANLTSVEAKINKLDEKLVSLSDPVVALPPLFQQLEWCLESYKLSNPAHDVWPSVRLFQLTHDIFRRFKSDLNTQQQRAVQVALLSLGFDESTKIMAQAFVDLGGEANEVQVNEEDEEVQDLPGGVNMSCRRFQMKHFGPYMTRNVQSAPDARVTGFYPDAWQRELLDIVDKKQSALVVAPTSSGKTFVSYYAMKQILQENKSTKRTIDKGIIVFVCPTKALVNQVAADVYTRYGAVFGILTDDYAHKVVECEVLVTVPTGLQKIMLSPQREIFCKRIRYAILDEVHSIGEPTGGEAWERAILMLRCPFVALSATLGRPEVFEAWLKRVSNARTAKEKQRGEVKLVMHRERWSDLEKSIYLPKTPSQNVLEWAGKVNINQDKRELGRVETDVYGINPFAALNMGEKVDLTTGFPADLKLSPANCLELYDAMVEEIHARKEESAQDQDALAELSAVQARLDKLNPEIFFPPLVITKVETLQFEQALKAELTRWVQPASKLKADFQAVLDNLSAPMNRRFAAMEKSATQADLASCYNQDFVANNFLPMLLDLEKQDRLPIVVFSHDRKLCTRLVFETLDKLEELERLTLASETTRKASRRDAKNDKKKKKAAKRARDKDDSKNKDEDKIEGEELDAGDAVEDDDDYPVDDRFTFVKPGHKMDPSELDYWLRRTMRKGGWTKKHPLIRCLARGIAVHHGGLSRNYRSLVETLFRYKHIRVVVATETLSLGVNMPARSTAFAGDSSLLTPQAFRQMMGRAGRRGYDAIGHVNFIGVPPRKISYLMTSELISLNGHFPLTTNTALDMTILNTKVQDGPYCRKTMANLLQSSFVDPSSSSAGGSSKLPQQIKYHFRFAMEFLFQQGLVDRSGKSVGLSGLISHLSKADGDNFAFAKLVNDGIFHDMCLKFNAKNAKIVAKDLMLILAHLFVRIPLPGGAAAQTIFAHQGEHLIQLPPLPAKVAVALDKYNQHAVSQFTEYCRTFCKTQLDKDEITLPLSNVKLTTATASKPDSGIAGHFAQTAAPCDTIAPALAISGHRDQFLSALDLASHVRSDMFVTESMVPALERQDVRGADLALNSYAYDFFNTGNYRAVLNENGIQIGFAWEQLKKWSLILRDIATAMAQMSNKDISLEEDDKARQGLSSFEDDRTVRAFQFLSQEFDKKFRGIE